LLYIDKATHQLHDPVGTYNDAVQFPADFWHQFDILDGGCDKPYKPQAFNFSDSCCLSHEFAGFHRQCLLFKKLD
jgi:hypothetical protein